MKILFLAPQPFFLERGTPIAVRMAVETLARRGHSIDLLTYHEGADVAIDGVRLVRIAAPPGVRGVPVGPSWKKLVCDVFFLVKFLRMAQGRRYDVIHAVEEAATIAHGTRWIHRTPYIVDMDSSIPSQLVETFPALAAIERPLRALETHTLRSSLGVVAVCKELAKIAERAGVKGPIGVVEDAALEDGTPPPAAPSAPAAPPRLRAELGLDAAMPLVLYVGNLQSYQGVGLLVDAFARTKQAGVLVVVGGDRARIDALRTRAETLGVAGRVHWTGPRPLADLFALLREADILASPRLHGVNTPMKIYSYLASGVPIVATDILSHTQVLTPDVAALAAPDVDALAAALDRLLGDAALRDRLGAAGAALARREFSREAFDRKLGAFYGDVEARLAALRGGRGGAKSPARVESST